MKRQKERYAFEGRRGGGRDWVSARTLWVLMNSWGQGKKTDAGVARGGDGTFFSKGSFSQLSSERGGNSEAFRIWVSLELVRVVSGKGEVGLLLRGAGKSRKQGGDKKNHNHFYL